ncbi:hypothetical protein pb186bvf_006156 [Paramecium bursaria]
MIIFQFIWFGIQYWPQILDLKFILYIILFKKNQHDKNR